MPKHLFAIFLSPKSFLETEQLHSFQMALSAENQSFTFSSLCAHKSCWLSESETFGARWQISPRDPVSAGRNKDRGVCGFYTHLKRALTHKQKLLRLSLSAGTKRKPLLALCFYVHVSVMRWRRRADFTRLYWKPQKGIKARARTPHQLSKGSKRSAARAVLSLASAPAQSFFIRERATKS